MSLQTAADLAPGIVTASNPVSTVRPTLAIPLWAASPAEPVLIPIRSISSANGSYGTLQINANGTYIYTLDTSRTTRQPDADNGHTAPKQNQR